VDSLAEDLNPSLLETRRLEQRLRLRWEVHAMHRKKHAMLRTEAAADTSPSPLPLQAEPRATSPQA
jgi:hypothetical protein